MKGKANNISETDAQIAMFSSGVQAMLTAENAAIAGDYLREKAGELASLATEGDRKIRNLAIAVGWAMVITSVAGMIGKIMRLNFFGALISFYTTILGFVVLTLESKMMPVPNSWVLKLHHYALFLKYVWGRGYTYFIAGSLQASEWNLADTLVGFLMMIIGFMYITTGRNTAAKLLQLRIKLYSQDVLMQKFYQFDSGGDGTLDRDALRCFMESLGLRLDDDELETAFGVITSGDSNAITFDEFYSWWESWNFDARATADMMV